MKAKGKLEIIRKKNLLQKLPRKRPEERRIIYFDDFMELQCYTRIFRRKENIHNVYSRKSGAERRLCEHRTSDNAIWKINVMREEDVCFPFPSA